MPSKIKKEENGLVCDSYRIIDANLNRAKEGMRVCEDICRFNLRNRSLSKALSAIRHELTSIIKISDCDQLMLIKYRDVSTDVGMDFSLGLKRKSFKNIFLANAQRVKEALRVLEEFMKIFDSHSSKKIQKLRFAFYAFEKKTISKFPSLLDIR